MGLFFSNLILFTQNDLTQKYVYDTLSKNQITAYLEIIGKDFGSHLGWQLSWKYCVVNLNHYLTHMTGTSSIALCKDFLETSFDAMEFNEFGRAKADCHQSDNHNAKFET